MMIHQNSQLEASRVNSKSFMPHALRIEELRTRSAPLDMTSNQFRSLGHDLVDRIADFLASIRTNPVTRAESPEEVRAALAANRALPACTEPCC